MLWFTEVQREPKQKTLLQCGLWSKHFLALEISTERILRASNISAVFLLIQRHMLMATDGHKVRARSLPALSLPIQINIIVSSTTPYFYLVLFCFCMCVCVCCCDGGCFFCLFVCFSPRKKPLPEKLPIETLFSEVVLCCLRITTYSFNPLRVVIKLLLILPRRWLLATTKLLQSVSVL